MHLDDAFHFPFREVGQRYIIAKEEGKARIIILKIKAFPHPFGELIDKAEHALIRTVALPVHQIGVKGEAQILIFILFDPDLPVFSPRAAQREGQPSLGGIKLIIEDIDNLMAVDLH